MEKRDAVPLWRASRQDEVDSAHVYRAIAEHRGGGDLYARLAEAEERHAARCVEQLRALGAEVGALGPTRRARILAFLGRRFGPRFVLSALVRDEGAAEVRYGTLGAAGIAIARDALRECTPMVQGVYVMPPFGNVAAAIEVLEAAPRLRLVIVPFIGTDKIDVRAATRLGILVANSPTPENFVAVAEAAIMLALADEAPGPSGSYFSELQLASPGAVADDAAVRAALWEATARLAGLAAT